MEITFCGAAGEVTGSCYLITTGKTRLLVDCGLFQGTDDETKNRAPFGFAPASIDDVLLTHAHLDHCGRLPSLIRQGFRGEIVAPSATKDLMRLILLDDAHLQENESKRTTRQHLRSGKSLVLRCMMRSMS